MPLTPGQTILNGKYRIVKLIGEGACARVWLAEEPEFAGRQVAIKELKREALTPTELEEQERRFRQEVEMAAQLGQARVPHVIRAITLEHLEDGTRLLVMELAEGGSLADRIAEHPEGMAIEEAVQITLDLCQALQGFHDLESSPVHRDVKPSNILFDRQGNAYLADFGLCQLPGRSERTHVQAGPHPATPLYAAPEQLRSPEPLTPAADICALGCVLFEMLTGKPYKRVRPGTKPGALRSEVPGWLDGVVEKAVVEDPWERYQEAAQMAAALQAELKQAVAPSHELQMPKQDTPLYSIIVRTASLRSAEFLRDEQIVLKTEGRDILLPNGRQCRMSSSGLLSTEYQLVCQGRVIAVGRKHPSLGVVVTAGSDQYTISHLYKGSGLQKALGIGGLHWECRSKDGTIVLDIEGNWITVYQDIPLEFVALFYGLRSIALVAQRRRRP